MTKEVKLTKPMFIVLCGLDGAGKSTQINLVKPLLEKSAPVVVTRQPTSWYRDNTEVKKFLSAGGTVENARYLALLAAADRRWHVETVIRPALAKGQHVLCDRYVYSSYAYFQARGLSIEFVRTINEPVLRPDLAVFLDVAPTELRRRLEERGEPLKHEEASLDTLIEIRSFFLRIPELRVIDALKPPEEIAADIFSFAKGLSP